MSEILLDDFQSRVSDSLIRHKSIIDIMTKLGEYNARVNRAVAKSVTSCGCIKICAEKQKISEDAFLEDISKLLSYHVEGELCENCREVLEHEIGTNIYYLAALCDALGISLLDVLLKENDKITTLGKFTLL